MSLRRIAGRATTVLALSVALLAAGTRPAPSGLVPPKPPPVGLAHLSRGLPDLWPVSPPFQRLEIVPVAGLPAAWLTALTTWQGVVNQTGAATRVYLLAEPTDRWWLRAIPRTVARRWWPAAPHPGRPARWAARLLRAFPVARGLIVTDPRVPATLDVATTLAGLDRGIVATPGVAAALQAAGRRLHARPLPVLVNLGRMGWTTNVAADTWAVSTLLPRTNPATWAEIDLSIAGGLRDYAVAHRLFVANLPGPNPGAATWALWDRVLARYRPDTPVMGFPPSEGLDLPALSASGHWLNASARVDNLSVWAVRVPAKTLPVPAWPSASPVPLRPDHIYLSFQWSDGDNLRFLTRRLPLLWAHPHARIPQSWTISPALPRTAPWIWAWLVRHAPPHSQWMAAPSGIGYTQSYPLDLLPGFVRLTRDAAAAEHLASINVWGNGRAGALSLAEAPYLAGPPLRTVFVGEGDTAMPWFYVGETVFLEPVNGYTPTRRILLADVLAAVAREQAAHLPLVLPVFVNGWKLTPADLAWVVRRLGRLDPVTVVGASVLGASVVASLHPGTAWPLLQSAAAPRAIRVDWATAAAPPVG